MNRRLALKVFIIDKETSGLVIIKNKSLVPWWALGFIFNNHQAIGLYLLHKSQDDISGVQISETNDKSLILYVHYSGITNKVLIIYHLSRRF